MKFLERVRFAFGSKESQARVVSSFTLMNKAVSTPINYENLARIGYMKNQIVFSAISKIARSAGGINWVLYSGTGKNKKEIEVHPLLNLWNRPNPFQAKASFVESNVA